MSNENIQPGKQATRSMSFEEAMDQLEQLVRSMESGNIKLEDMIQKFVEARKLSAYCQTQLNSLKEKIEILTNDDPNNPRYQDFRHESENRADFIPGKASQQAAQVTAEQKPAQTEASATPASQAISSCEPARRRSRVHAVPVQEEKPAQEDNSDGFLPF